MVHEGCYKHYPASPYTRGCLPEARPVAEEGSSVPINSHRLSRRRCVLSVTLQFLIHLLFFLLSYSVASFVSSTNAFVWARNAFSSSAFTVFRFFYSH